MSGWRARDWIADFAAVGGSLMATENGGLATYISMIETTQDEQLKANALIREVTGNRRRVGALRRLTIRPDERRQSR